MFAGVLVTPLQFILTHLKRNIMTCLTNRYSRGVLDLKNQIFIPTYNLIIKRTISISVSKCKKYKTKFKRLPHLKCFYFLSTTHTKDFYTWTISAFYEELHSFFYKVNDIEILTYEWLLESHFSVKWVHTHWMIYDKAFLRK